MSRNQSIRRSNRRPSSRGIGTVPPGPRFAGDEYSQQRMKHHVSFITAMVKTLRKRTGTAAKGCIRDFVDRHNKIQGDDLQKVTYNQVVKRLQVQQRIKKPAPLQTLHDSSDDDSSDDDSVVHPLQYARAGRPKGTSNKESQYRKRVVSSFKDTITAMFKQTIDLDAVCSEHDQSLPLRS